MRVIKTFKDIELLKKAEALEKPYLEFLKNHFLALHSYIGDDQTLEDFSLVEYGYLVVLEAGDNVRDLQEFCLNPEAEGILCGLHEFIDVETLADGTKLYKIGIVCNNEFMMTFFSKKDQFFYDKEFENWLRMESFLEEQ